jgi:hypothetical protein
MVIFAWCPVPIPYKGCFGVVRAIIFSFSYVIVKLIINLIDKHPVRLFLVHVR